MQTDVFVWLTAWAQTAPSSTAIASNGLTLSYADLKIEVEQLSVNIRASGRCRIGQLVVVGLVDPLLQWVTMLALMRCGAVPCPMLGPLAGIAGLQGAAVICDPDRLDQFSAVFGANNCMALSQALQVSNGDAEPLSPVTAMDSDVAIVLLSSGTTGPAKAVPLTWQTVGQRTALRHRYFPIRGPVVSLMQPGFAGGFQTCLSALQHGLCVDISDNFNSIAAAANSPETCHLIGSPAQLSTLVNLLDQEGLRNSHIESVLSMGGIVSKPLADTLRQRFGGTLLSLYGSTELGACAVMQPGADVLTLLPGVTARAIGPVGQPLADGDDGLLQLRAPGMAFRFLPGTETGASAFQDGWFAPGDTGRVQNGTVQLRGRIDEVVNIGGLKIDPSELDALVLAMSLGGDAASFKFSQASGEDVLMIAVVAASDADYRDAKAKIAAIGGLPPGKVGFFRVDAVPRGAMGKPLRGALAASLQQVLDARSSAQETE